MITRKQAIERKLRRIQVERESINRKPVLDHYDMRALEDLLTEEAETMILLEAE